MEESTSRLITQISDEFGCSAILHRRFPQIVHPGLLQGEVHPTFVTYLAILGHELGYYAVAELPISNKSLLAFCLLGGESRGSCRPWSLLGLRRSIQKDLLIQVRASLSRPHLSRCLSGRPVFDLYERDGHLHTLLIRAHGININPEKSFARTLPLI